MGQKKPKGPGFDSPLQSYSHLARYFAIIGPGKDVLNSELEARGWNKRGLNSVQLDVLATQADEYAAHSLSI